MFRFLKDKLKGALSRFSKSIDDAAEETEPEKDYTGTAPEAAGEKPRKEKTGKAGKKKTEPEKITGGGPRELREASELLDEKEEESEEELKKQSERIQTVAEKEEIIEEKNILSSVEEGEKKGIFRIIREAITGKKEETAGQEKSQGIADRIKEQITTKKISREKFHELFWDLEVTLLENSVAMEVIEKIKRDLEKELVDKPLPRTRVGQAITATLKKTLEGLFAEAKTDLMKEAKRKKPLVILFLGINGSGKTTTIAKTAKMLMDNKLKVVLAAGDTFRAASIEQLQQHADKLGVKLIKHDYGADPAAVAFDAIKFAEAKGIDAVLIDTAGRLHSNTNLMDEMKKIVRVAKPDMKIFVGESITGNDCVEQARAFDQAVGIDGIILSKADVDDKGGAAISISYITKKPILYLGTGQRYEDLTEFEPRLIIEGLGLS